MATTTEAPETAVATFQHPAARAWAGRALRAIARSLGSIVRMLFSVRMTVLWLSVLWLTTFVENHLPDRQLDWLLTAGSTNLHNLTHCPFGVMLTSLLWLDDAAWLPYALLFVLFVAPVERWLGWRRALAIGLLAHVIATLFSEGLLALWIHLGYSSPALVHAHDIGVSYVVAAMVGVLSYRLPKPLRYVYVPVVATIYLVPLLTGPNVTSVGHMSALLIGLAAYPLTVVPSRQRRRQRQHPRCRTVQSDQSASIGRP